MDSHRGNTGATNSAPRLSTCVKSWRDGPSALLAVDSTLAQIGAHDHSTTCNQIFPVSMFASGALELAALQQAAQDTIVVNNTKAAVP